MKNIGGVGTLSFFWGGGELGDQDPPPKLSDIDL